MKSKVLGLLAVGLLAGPLTANAVGVFVGGKEWRQLTETTLLSWNQVATVCNPTTGVCNGSIGAVSFTGWIWAANTDVQALFDELIQPGTVNFPDVQSGYVARNDPDIAAAFGPGRFAPTINFSADFRGINGFVRSLYDAGFAFTPRITDATRPVDLDFASLDLRRRPYEVNPLWGIWLYRSAAVTVPEPAPVTLLALGLLAMVTIRRRSRALQVGA